MRLIPQLAALLVAGLLAAGCLPSQTTGGQRAPMPSAASMNESGLAVNTAKPGDKCDPKKETCWNAANVAPFGNRGVELALSKLLHRGLIPDDAKRARVTAGLLARVQAGPNDVAPIPPNFRSTNMVYADGVVLPNVVSGVEHWRADQTRQADWYEFRDRDGTLYVLFRPHVCSNWSLRIITLQGYCIYDEILCQGECLKLRKEVMGVS